MGNKVVAIIGSYRKGGITDQAVEAVLEAIRQKGGKTEKIYLTDKHLEFCTNCRACTQQASSEKRGRCVLNDDAADLLDKIDAADGLVFAAPINFFSVTALMKKFIERFVAYAYWPWGQHAPVNRMKKKNKKAIVITSSACPAWIGRVLMPNAVTILKTAAEVVGSKVVRVVYYGAVCLEEKQKLSARQIRLAKSAAVRIAI